MRKSVGRLVHHKNKFLFIGLFFAVITIYFRLSAVFKSTKTPQVRLKYGDRVWVTERKNGSKTILFFCPKFEEVEMLKHVDKFASKCEKKCNIATHPLAYNTSDAVIFLLDTLPTLKLPPKKQGQVWIISEVESPDSLKEYQAGGILLMKPEILTIFDNKVNWTWTYRRDSDFPFVHGGFRKIMTKRYANQRNNTLSMLQHKSKSAVTFVSHCNTIVKREKSVEALRKAIPVDIYGKCGIDENVLNCSDQKGEDRFLQVWGFEKNTCFDILDRDYNFYLGFENTLCRDYITEKGLHNIVQHDVIPVMRSGVNHSIFNPPNSYIDANRFKSDEKLGTYLNNLQKHKEKMLKYYEWKQYYESSSAIDIWYDNLCNICKRLNDPVKYNRLYSDVYRWLAMPNDKNACFQPLL